ncbi:alpha/beta hydrolase [Chitinophaga eiseniae]|uniref:Alpha/beta hydrolase n=1 Tax=Chitinophaga eiseniae TaxID=634771 RepID=A0A847SL89_9BACT|nr:alpha/beta hydrolase [Chitinophaga eiseniae]NLR79557.1 alpha/beta hydrolase [Chitinophaga eiseniae]
MKRFLAFFIFATIALSSAAQKVLPLYKDSIPNSIGTIAPENAPVMTLYKPEHPNGTAVIIFPGGAYGGLAIDEEGFKVAEAFITKGVTAFVVKYRLPSDVTMRDKSMGPLQDAQQAIKLVRMNATEWGIDKNRIGIAGYSAGGHLAATLGTHSAKSYVPNKEKIDLRPDFMILVYAVISMHDELTHQGSRSNLIGPSPSPEKVAFFSNEEWVNNNTPPAYITHCNDDAVVSVNNSIAFYQAMQKGGIPAELHLYPTGNHGFTQRLPVYEWLDPMLWWMKRGGWLPNTP